MMDDQSAVAMAPAGADPARLVNASAVS